MEQTILSAFSERNWDLVKLILFNKCQFREIQHVIGSDQFSHIIPKIQLLRIEEHQVLELQTTNLYYFITGGMSGGKKNDKIIKLKSKKSSTRKKAIISNDARSPLNFAEPIKKDSLSKMQQFFLTQLKTNGLYYSTNSCNIILKLKQSSLQPSSMQKLRTYFSQKVRNLGKLEVFSEVPRQLIHQIIDNFLFTKIYFNDLIYSRTIRTSNIIFLMKGQSIIESDKKNQGIIVKAPNVLGLDKLSQNQQSRCLTQFCVCYTITLSNFQQIFKKKAAQDQNQYSGLSSSIKKSLRSTYFKTIMAFSQNSTPIQETNRSAISQKQQMTLQPLFRNISKNRSKNSLQIGVDKRDRIKQHFSNFINEKYSQYSMKVQKNLDQNKENPILYKMQSLVPKIPNYDEIKNRFKQIRIRKILQSKQNIGKTNSSSSLLYLRQCQAAQLPTYHNDIILAKIQRSLDIKIAKQINKKYGVKLRIIK